MSEVYIVLFRSIITFIILMLYARIIGKQQIGNLTIFDYINGITMGSIAATMATDLSSRALTHWIALTVFVMLTIIMQLISIKSRIFSNIVNSEPLKMVQDGKILEGNLRKARITIDELMVQLRGKNVFDITEVEAALLEPDGSLSVLPRSEYRTVKLKDLNLQAPPSHLTTEVIYNGVVIENNLKQRNKSMEWLFSQLQTMGIHQLEEVVYAAILPNDTLYIDKYNDDYLNE